MTNKARCSVTSAEAMPVTSRSRQQSPLAMMVLSFLVEAPSHTYRMHDLIKRRGKDNVVNVARRNSVYQTVRQLLGAKLIRVLETQQGEGRPERVVYAITPLGRKTFYAWLEGMLGEPRHEFNEFPAALATTMALSPDVVLAALRRRRHTLKRQMAESTAATREVLRQGLPRICVLDDAYKQALLKAEIKWLEDLATELEAGTMTWSEQELRQLAVEFETRGSH